MYVHKYVRIHKHMSIEMPYVHIYALTYVHTYIHMFECPHAEFRKSAAKGKSSVVKLSG